MRSVELSSFGTLFFVHSLVWYMYVSPLYETVNYNNSNLYDGTKLQGTEYSEHINGNIVGCRALYGTLV